LIGTALGRELRTDYLYQLTDDTGIFQHSKFGVPDRAKGYTTDDNARALIAAVMLYKEQRDRRSLDLVCTYLAFVHHAQTDDGHFRNFMNYQRAFIEERGSEDCFGRCLWALGFTLSESCLPDSLRNTCRYALNQALTRVTELRSPRAVAYAMVGLSDLLGMSEPLAYAFPSPHVEETVEAEQFLRRDRVQNIVDELSRRLQRQFDSNRSADWNWFEDSITYGNAMLPLAMLKAARVGGDETVSRVAKQSLDFLLSITFSHGDFFKPVGNQGWLQRNGDASEFDEQPIEACETLLACREAFTLYGDPKYLTLAQLCYDWFHGRNSIRESLIDEQTGACYDGIHYLGINLNQGSENVISYCIAHLAMKGGPLK